MLLMYDVIVSPRSHVLLFFSDDGGLRGKSVLATIECCILEEKER